MNSTMVYTTLTTVLEKQDRRNVFSLIKRGLKWLGIGLGLMLALGFVFQRVGTAIDETTYSPRGRLYTVNNRQMHILCEGDGSPVVVLEAGGAAETLWWYRVQKQLAEHTRVCAYDRAGHGWSESASGLRDPQSIVSDLHALLQEAEVSSPYILAGHSFGAVWARIYAGSYPYDVVGLAMVDSTILVPKSFANQDEFSQWKSSNDGIKALEQAAYEFGAIRLTASGDFEGAGYPLEIVPQMAALRARINVFEADYSEQVAAGWELRRASAAAENLGSLPTAVLWASETNTMMETVPALRDIHNEISMYSSNTTTHVLEGANHGSILGSEQYAQQVSDAILDIIEAVETGEPLSR